MKVWKDLKLSFDRSFSFARFRQISWLVVFLAISFAIFYGLNEVLGRKVKHPMQLFELMIDPGTFAAMPYEESIRDRYGLNEEDVEKAQVAQPAVAMSQTVQPVEQMPDKTKAELTDEWVEEKAYSLGFRIFELIITLFGAAFFTGILISIISNMLEGHVEQFKKGLIRYDFSDHILILGANEMLANMLKAFSQDEKASKRDVVILSTFDTEQLRARLYSELNDMELKKVVLLFGSRDSDEELRHVNVAKAASVYIIGEEEETHHDARNISCCERVTKLCQDRKEKLKCFMVINNLSSYHVLQYRRENDFPKLEMTIINLMENRAQSVLVTRRFDSTLKYPAIDRDGISADSDYRVHFVVVGMTQMALSMATTVAQIAHFPNFSTKGKKTRITFIDPNIEQEMNFFKGHYDSLFQLSYSCLRRYEDGQMKTIMEQVPNPEYGDFLDVEWEFIDGGVETAPVRDLIRQWSDQRNPEYLTIAVCNNTSEENIATSLYLPEEVYTNQIPLFVYQPEKGDVLLQAMKTSRYGNIYPFGMLHDCYDPQLQERIRYAKRINYLYTKGEDFVQMPSCEEDLNAEWYNLSFANQLSNIYAVNSAPTKLRSIGLSEEQPVELTEEQIEMLATMEHNRWNMEKLLVGFKPLTIQQEAEYTNEQKKQLKQKFVHHLIRPNDEIPAGARIYDLLICRYIYKIIEKPQGVN